MQQHAVGHYISAGTVALVATPSTGRRIKVNNLHLSVGAAETVTVGFSSTNQRVWNLAANAGADEPVMDWRGDAATALNVTFPSGTGPVDVTVDYEVEDAP